MAVDFARDLARDGVPPEKIRAQLKRSQDRLTSAPVAILLCLDMSDMDQYPDEKRQQAEWTMAVQSVAAAGQQLLLAAHAERLAGVWACWPLFARETVVRALDLPETWDPQGMCFLGYADEQPRTRPRKGILEVSVFR